MQGPTSRATRIETSRSDRSVGSGRPAGGLLELAHGYAALGWPVFPLVPRGKVPLYANPHPRGSAERAACRGRWESACPRDGHGVLDAALDPAVLDEWWHRTPSANIGIACGTTARGGAPTTGGAGVGVVGDGPDVVDFDVKDGAPGRVSFERLRDAGLLSGAFAMVSTPSGGWHLYYAGSAQGNGVVRGFGVDFRSAGGYVVAPGCPAGGGRYAWTWGPRIPDRGVDFQAIRDYLKPPPPPRPIETMRFETQATADGLVAFVAGQTTGNRQSGLFWAALRALEDGHGEPVLSRLGDEARANGLPDVDVRKALGSARRRAGVRAGVR